VSAVAAIRVKSADGELVFTAFGYGVLPSEMVDAEARKHGAGNVSVAPTGTDYVENRWEPYTEWAVTRQGAW
jgi:hypothetical protein